MTTGVIFNFLIRCAWCSREKSTAGIWSMNCTGHPEEFISHGICPICSKSQFSYEPKAKNPELEYGVN